MRQPNIAAGTGEELTLHSAQLISKVRAAQQRAHLRVAPEQKIEPQQMSLPFPWGEEMRGVPNILIRCAIFAVVRAGQRRSFKQEQIYSLDGYTIIYTGEQLDQGDLDIWQQAIHLCQRTLGDFVPCSKKQLLRALDRGEGKENKLWLTRGLDRLVAASAKLIDTRAGSKEDPRQFNDNLLGYKMDGDRLLLRVSKDWATFFLREAYTLIDWERRLSLPPRSQLAKWLHDFYSSHADPFPMKAETLRDLCGCKTTDIHRFRANLRAALEELRGVGLLSEWRINPRNDLVIVKKNASRSQNRYLVRRALRGQAFLR